MFDVDLGSPMKIPVEKVEMLVARATGASSDYVPLKLATPSIEELAAVVPLSALEIPWEVPFEGFRLSKFNQSGLRLLQRNAGTVTWSRVLEPKHRTGVYKDFLQGLQSAIYRWEWLALYPPGESVRYDLATCARLLRETFLRSEPPRLIPRFSWPDRATCVEIVRARIGSLPWKHEDYSGVLEAKHTENGYFLEVRGERHDLEKVIAETDADEFYWRVFKHLVQYDMYADDSQFAAKWFMFADDAS